MTATPVISATHTIGDGLVIRWRHTAEGEPVVSASRNAVMVHGTVIVSDTIKQWIADAERARELIRSGREDQAKALATHKYDKPFFGELVPIAKERPVESEPEDVCRGFRWIGQSFATCDGCGKPAWEHEGMLRLREGAPLFGGGTDDDYVEPWKPGEAEAIKRKWGSAS